MRRLKRVLRVLGLVLVVLLVVLGVAWLIFNEPRPTGAAGPQAEALAARIERAVDVEAWGRTKAVRWRFAGMHDHLWDRERDLVRVRWDDAEVLAHAFSASGRAYVGGREVVGGGARDLLVEAQGHFVNDSFWLNPLAKLHDPGTRRELVTVDGRQALYVSYSSGGLTPGDGYLWRVGDDGRPTAWKLWVSVLPIGGVETSWESWTTLSTGARISTRHRGPFGLTFELTDVAGAASLGELLSGGEDPFAPLLAGESAR